MDMKKVIYAILWIVISGGGVLQAQHSIADQLPMALPVQNFIPLRSLSDLGMEQALLQRLQKNHKWAELIQQKKLSVGVVDLSNPGKARFAHINGNEMMYAASLPKIAILLAAVDAFESGELEESNDVLSDIHLMIRKSDNHASTRMIDRLGFEKIETILTNPRYDFYDENYGGGLWVGKRYAASGRRYPDPLKGLSHAASVSQVCRFYYMLAYGQLVNMERSKQILDAMGNPGLHHKFVNSLEKLAPRARLFRKSGSWGNYHSDSILVWGPEWRRYILVALTEDPSGEQIIRNLVRPVEEILFTQHKSGPLSSR